MVFFEDLSSVERIIWGQLHLIFKVILPMKRMFKDYLSKKYHKLVYFAGHVMNRNYC